jgi:curved DNA-binding protein CbpA
VASFDPYLRWLGIPPEDQPPDHYRLLGVKPNEPDPELIARAAKRQMARVKNAQSGEDTQLAQEILKKIALARNCLLDPVRRREYDRQLEARSEPHTSPEPALARAHDPWQEEMKDGRRVAPNASDVQTPSGPVRGSKNTPHSRLISILFGGIAGTLLAVAILYAIRGRPARVAEQSPPPVIESHPTAAPTQPDPPAPAPDERAPYAPTRDSGEGAEKPGRRPVGADVARTAEPSESDTSPDARETPASDPQTRDSEPEDGQSAETGQDEVAAALKPELRQAPVDAPARPKKLPVPDDATQRRAEQRVRDLLQSEFDAANTPEQKLALATRLVELGRETTADPTTRFVLFRLAYQLSVAVGDWAKALGVVDTMGEHYEADVQLIKADVLGQVVEGLQVTPQTADAVGQVLDAVSDGLDAAVAADDYDAASRFLRTARLLARKMGNPALTRELGVREREIERRERAFDRVKTSLESVSRGSADAAANLEAGRWYCFEKNNWEKGLPLLGAGSDPALAELARRDLAAPEDCRQQLRLAEQWLQAAGNEPRLSASPMVARAQHWCDLAMPKLDEAVAGDDYETALGLVSVAIFVAREADDRESVSELTARRKELERGRQRFASIRRSLDALAADPDNREANLAAGQWYCFERGQWKKGLPLLAKGADADLAAVAQQEIAGADNPRDQLKLADAWWQRAEADRSPMKPAILSRAVYWYERALPRLSGLEKVRAEKRLEIAAAGADETQRDRGGVIQQGNVALAANGTTVVGQIEQGERLIDGNAEHSLAYAQWPFTWNIVFPKVYSLREIRILLYDEDDRYFRYAIAVSPDGETFVPLAESGQTEARSWQTIQFSPRPVKAVKLLGAYCSAGSLFHVTEFEAYCVPPGPPPARSSTIGP